MQKVIYSLILVIAISSPALAAEGSSLVLPTCIQTTANSQQIIDGRVVRSSLCISLYSWISKLQVAIVNATTPTDVARVQFAVKNLVDALQGNQFQATESEMHQLILIGIAIDSKPARNSGFVPGKKFSDWLLQALKDIALGLTDSDDSNSNESDSIKSPAVNSELRT